MKLNYLGAPVWMHGQNFYVPSLSYRDFKAHYDVLTSVPKDETKLFEYFDTILPIIGDAVRRNYPDVTEEQLGEWVDTTTLQMLVKAVQGQSGLTPVSEGE